MTIINCLFVVNLLRNRELDRLQWNYMYWFCMCTLAALTTRCIIYILAQDAPYRPIQSCRTSSSSSRRRFLAYFCQVGLIHLGHVSTNNCRYWLWKKTCSGDSQRTVITTVCPRNILTWLEFADAVHVSQYCTALSVPSLYDYIYNGKCATTTAGFVSSSCVLSNCITLRMTLTISFRDM